VYDNTDQDQANRVQSSATRNAKRSAKWHRHLADRLCYAPNETDA
jgi:hypothetical protein